MAEPIRAADQAIAHSTSLVNDLLEDRLMFRFPLASTFATMVGTIRLCISERYLATKCVLIKKVNNRLTDFAMAYWRSEK